MSGEKMDGAGMSPEMQGQMMEALQRLQAEAETTIQGALDPIRTMANDLQAQKAVADAKPPTNEAAPEQKGNYFPEGQEIKPDQSQANISKLEGLILEMQNRVAMIETRLTDIENQLTVDDMPGALL